jgi:hypothetical protein
MGQVEAECWDNSSTDVQDLGKTSRALCSQDRGPGSSDTSRVEGPRGDYEYIGRR